MIPCRMCGALACDHTNKAPMEAVAWRYKEKDCRDITPWGYRETRPHPNENDVIEPLFTHPPQPDALPGDLREKVARRAAAAILEQDGYSAVGPYLNADLTLDYLDQGEVDFGKVADAILSLIQSERGEP